MKTIWNNIIYVIIILNNIFSINAHETEESFEDVVENRKLLKTTSYPDVHYNFNYGIGPRGPSFWSTFYPSCSGKSQSPINIDVRTVQEVQLETLKWDNYDILPNTMYASNNGYSVSIIALLPNNVKPIISGGPLTTSYEFVALHFHWGMDEGHGSEHTITEKNYVMEMHCLHKLEGAPFNLASIKHNGLVAIAYLFELSSEDNPAIHAILEMHTQLMVDLNIPLKLLNTFKLSELIEPFTKDYIAYQGSLTTPPCTESVIWLISPYPLYISLRQLSKFRKISEAVGLENNFRPLQPVGNRTIYLVTSKSSSSTKEQSSESDNDDTSGSGFQRNNNGKPRKKKRKWLKMKTEDIINSLKK